MGSCRAASRFAPSQWETALLCNTVSHWPGASLEWALLLVPFSLHDTCDKRLSWPDEGVSPVAPHMKWSCPLPPKCDYDVTCVLIVISCQNQYTSDIVITHGLQCPESSEYSGVMSNEICKWFCCASQAPYQDAQCNMPMFFCDLVCYGYHGFLVDSCYLFAYIQLGFSIGHWGNCMIVLWKWYGHKELWCWLHDKQVLNFYGEAGWLIDWLIDWLIEFNIVCNSERPYTTHTHHKTYCIGEKN